MTTKLTDAGVYFPGNDPNNSNLLEQKKAILKVEGVEADTVGEIKLSTSIDGKTLDERINDLEGKGGGGGSVYLDQDTFGISDYMFKDFFWYGGESVYSYSSATADQKSEIRLLLRGNILNLTGDSTEIFYVSKVDDSAQTITLKRGTFNNRGTSDLTVQDPEGDVTGSFSLTYQSHVEPQDTTELWLQVFPGENNSGAAIDDSDGDGVEASPMDLTYVNENATHILFRVISETSGSLRIYNREDFITKSKDAPLLESELVHQVDVESSGSQSSSDEFWIPANSFLKFWLSGTGNFHLYPVAYTVQNLQHVNLDGASIPEVTLLSQEIDELEDQLSNLSGVQQEVDNLDGRVQVLEAGGGGGDVNLHAPPVNLYLDRGQIDKAEHNGNNWVYGPLNNETYPANPSVYLNFNVSQFENFFDNHSDNYKLAIYSGDMYAEVIISDLVSFFNAANSQTSDKRYYIHYDDTQTRDNELWFEFKNNDLIIRALTPSTTIATMRYIYRIDMHLTAFGGGVSSLNNRTGDLNITAGDNISLVTTSDSIQISASGGGVETLTETLFYDKSVVVDNLLTSSGASPFYYDHTRTDDGNRNRYVPEFKNFKINHKNKHKLMFYSSTGNFEVLISDLIDVNPTVSNPFKIQVDSEHYRDERSLLWFVGDDLYYKLTCTSGAIASQDAWPPYRIDLQNFAESPLNVYTKTEVDDKFSVDAWVNFTSITNGDTTIKDSRNVTSVTDNGAGDYTINFTSGTFSTNNYAISGISISNAGNASSQVCIKSAGAHTGTFSSYPDPELQSTTQVRVLVAGTDGVPKDTGMLHIIAVGK